MQAGHTVPIEIETGPAPVGSVIWLHGLGADGHDFVPLVPELMRQRSLPLRFIFPHAQLRPVTVNGGYVMRAWYDIHSFDRDNRQEDVAGIEASAAVIRALIARENERGIDSERIVLAGFSQGGAMVLYTGTRLVMPLAGIMALSCYLPLAGELAATHSAGSVATPVFMAHGRQDPVLPHEAGVRAREALKAAGYRVQWHSYDMPHAVCPAEVADIAAFLGTVLGAAAPAANAQST
jgi:phospholipase/carboxylesterase